MNTNALPQYEKVPLEKIFGFKHARVPMPVHPQIRSSAITKQATSTNPASPASTHQVNDVPRITFSLYYDMQRRTLTVCLMEGTHLPAKDRRGTSDPFVILFLLPDKKEIFETKVHKKSLNPIFNEVFEFHGLLPNEIRRQTLVLRVLDKDTLSSSDDMGTAIVQLEKADLYGVRLSATLSDEPDVQDDSKGDVLISMMYNSFSNVISGVLLKATNLQRMDISGSSDPYVKIYLVYEAKRVAKWKSTIKTKTLVPIYNEKFQFDVTDMDISFVQLQVSVKDYDRLGRNDLMGSFTLGERSEQSSGRLHWQEMISHPRTPINRWHSLGVVTKQTGSLLMRVISSSGTGRSSKASESSSLSE